MNGKVTLTALSTPISDFYIEETEAGAKLRHRQKTNTSWEIDFEINIPAWVFQTLFALQHNMPVPTITDTTVRHECERMWLLPAMPNEFLQNEQKKMLQQGYFGIGGLRIRQTMGKHEEIGLKLGESKTSRAEWEEIIPPKIFTLLWLRTQGRRISKTRLVLPFLGTKLELDIVNRKHDSPLYLLEAEFKNQEELHRFRLPSWVIGAKEVTNDHAFENMNLAE